MKLCYKCRHSMYFQAFSSGTCKICGEKIMCPHMPCYEICEKCATAMGLCIQCGKEMENENFIY